MKTTKIKNIFLILFMSFMIMQPILDIYYLYTDSVIEIFKFSPSTIIRMVIMGCLFLTSFFWFKDKRKYIYIIIFGIVFMLYSIFHNYNSLNFVPMYGNYTYSTLKELFYLIRMLMPLLLIFITYEKKISFKQLSIIITSVAIIFSIIMIITNIFEVAITSYNFGNKIIKANIFKWFIPGIYEKYGYEYIASKGIFHMANQISATFLCLLPVNIYIYFKSKKNLNLITIFLLIISMLMLGTRVASVGWILIVLVMSIMYIFFERKSLNVKKIILLLIITGVNLVILTVSPVMNRTYITGEEVETTEKDIKDLKKFISKVNKKENNASTKEELQKIREEKIKYVKDKYKIFKIDGNYIIDLYPYDGDVDFWLDEMTIPFEARANHRQLKKDITKRIIEINNNPYDYILGISFTRMRNAKIYMENDIYVHIYSIGIIGIIVFILPYALIALYAFYRMFKNKENFNYLNMTYLLCIGLVFVAGILSGNVFDEWIVTLFLGFICGLLLRNTIMDKKEKKVLFISSTGGHLSELLQLSPLIEKYNSYLITEKTKSNISLKNKFDNVNYLVYGTKKNLFKYLFVFSFNILKSLYYYIKIRPSVIITTGTHTAVPMCYIGKLFGSKVIFIETFANSKTKTLAGKLVYPIADTFIVQWESMLELYPKAIYGGWIF